MRFLKRQLSLPASMISQWWVRRSMGNAVEQRRSHLGITEDSRPLAEGKASGDDDAGALIRLADEVEQQLPSGPGERQITELVEHDQVEPRQLRRRGPAFPDPGLLFEACHLYARDLARVWSVAEALEYGIVGVNTGLTRLKLRPLAASRNRVPAARVRVTGSTIIWRSNIVASGIWTDPAFRSLVDHNFHQADWLISAINPCSCQSKSAARRQRAVVPARGVAPRGDGRTRR